MSYESTSSPLGFHTPALRNRVIVRGGDRVRGLTLMHDLANSDADVTDNETGRETSGFANVVTPTSGALGHGIFCVLEKATSDNQKGYVTYEGFVNALIIKASGNVAAGDPLTVDTNGHLTADGTIGHKIVAEYAPLDGATLTAPTTATLGRVRFSGFNPIGVLGA